MITVTLGNVNEIAGTIKKAQDFILSATADPQFLDKAGVILLASGKRNIEEGQAEGKQYAVLKPSTLKQKLKPDKDGNIGSSQPLIRNGNQGLHGSLNYNLDANLELSALEYAKYHQFGTKNMAQRKIFAPDRIDLDDLEDALRNSIVAKMQSL